MNAKQIIDNRWHELRRQAAEAEAKYKAALKDMRQKKERWQTLNARCDELLTLGINVEYEVRTAEDRTVDVDAETGERVSKMIWSCLANTGPRGATVAEIAGAIEHTGIKKSTVSATLYNMKKRGEIEHNEVAGLYRIPQRVMLVPPSAAPPTRPR